MAFERLKETREYQKLKERFNFLDDLLDKIAQDNLRSRGVEPTISEIEVKNIKDIPALRSPETGGWDFRDEEIAYHPTIVHLYSGIPSDAGLGKPVQITIAIYEERG